MKESNGQVTISKEMYNLLMLNTKKLHALEGAGVDNWEGYDFAMDMLAREEKMDD